MRAHFALAVVLTLSSAACSDSNPVNSADLSNDFESTTDGGPGEQGPGVDLSPPDAAACGAAIPAAPDVVHTHLGAVRGHEDGGSWAFLGIPFAAPPVGALRWQTPRDPSCWNDLREAKDYPPACAQKTFEQGQADGVLKGQEDCLYLNVWTPKAPASAPRPVLFFIHGGGNTQGASSNEASGAKLYDGALLAERGDAVVVTVQYRLGPLGFLALPELSAQAATQSSGNLGLLDQIHGLQWVQKNIAAFGGDAARVMIFGESAGAVNVCALYASPAAKGLFARALMQSGACVAQKLVDAEAAGIAFAKALGCDGTTDRVACLAQLEAKTLVANLKSPLSGGVAGGAGFGPVIDGHVLPAAPLDLIKAGTHNKVPFIVGANANETAPTVPVGTVTPLAVTLALSKFPEPYRSQLLAIYPPGASNAEARASWIRATTDSQFICQARAAARAAKAGQSEPVYRYFFSHTLPGIAGLLGAFHGLELFYVFQTIERSDYATQATADDTAVTAQLLGYWTRFAATGDPNGSGAVAWPTYDAASDPYLELAAPAKAGQGLRTTACDVWDAALAAMTP